MARKFSGAEFKTDPGVTKEMMNAAQSAVGQIALSWGFIESHLRAIYWILERTRGVPITAPEAPLEVVVDIVRQAGQRLPEFQGDMGELLAAAASEAKSIATVRNTVCHWVIVEGREKPRPALRFAQWRGDGPMTIWKDHWYTIRDLENTAKKSTQIADYLREKAMEAIAILEPDDNA